LQTLSRGSCYWPGCGEPVVRLVETEYYINYEIAHIRGAKERGARYNPNMSEEERKAFPNLILLCLVHHKHVDVGRHQGEYSPEMLLKWKSDREADGRDALAGLTRLTEDDLQDILTEAFAAKQEKIMEALERLEQNDADAANVMRGLLDELDQMRAYGPFLNPDSVEMLSSASDRLAYLGDNAETLHVAAGLLTNGVLEGKIESLQALIARLEDLRPDW